jgi:hypothetical protein
LTIWRLAVDEFKGVGKFKFQSLWKGRIHLSFLPKGGRAAEAFQSLFSYTDGKIWDGYGEDGCGRKVVGTERLILTQHSPYL